MTASRIWHSCLKPFLPAVEHNQATSNGGPVPLLLDEREVMEALSKGVLSLLALSTFSRISINKLRIMYMH
jgi:hypothetical protein